MATKDFSDINDAMDSSVDEELKARTHASVIDRTRKLIGAPPAGYLQNFYEYLNYCTGVEGRFNQKTQNSLKFPDPWKNANQGDTVEQFSAAGTNEGFDQANPKPKATGV